MGEELPTACKKRINGKFAGFRIWEALRGGITNPANAFFVIEQESSSFSW